MYSKKVRVEGNDVVIQNIPSTHHVIHKSHFSQIENNSKKLADVVKKFEATCYQPTSLGKSLVGDASTMMPQASQETLQYVIPVIVTASAVNAGLPCELKKVAKSGLGRNSISNALAD